MFFVLSCLLFAGGHPGLLAQQPRPLGGAREGGKVGGGGFDLRGQEEGLGPAAGSVVLQDHASRLRPGGLLQTGGWFIFGGLWEWGGGVVCLACVVLKIVLFFVLHL